jgi:hypothetical protein
MTVFHRTTIAAAVSIIALGLGVATASAETMSYKAELSASAETPPNTSAGKGTLGAQYDTATKKLTWTVTYSGLTGAATMAHFHGPADAGAAAPVMVPIKGEVTSPINGDAVLTDDQAKALMDGKMYFNIHTAANKGGEIRGQVVPAK